MKKNNRNTADSELFRAIVWGARHDAFDAEWGRSLMRAWSLGALDEQLAGELRNLVRPLQTQEAFGELSPFRKPRLPHGEILLGYDTGGNEILFPKQ